MKNDRRFIEETFPVRDVGAHAANEKHIHYGHISTLHIWWSRKPLAAARAIAYAALTPPPADEASRKEEHAFIANLSRWENPLNSSLLARARHAISSAHAERLSIELEHPVHVDDIETGRVPPPRVLDPFAGGGSFPLEALRLGCDAYANDYNPVAALILKATLEYPQQFGGERLGKRTRMSTDKTDAHGFRNTHAHGHPSLPSQSMGHPESPGQTEMFCRDAPVNPLLMAVKQWREWVLHEARKELAPFYPPSGANPIIGYIWKRTIPCQNPSCGVDIPLMTQFWLANKDRKKVALWIKPGASVDFEIVGDGYTPWPSEFDPEHGTVKGAVVTCPVCGATMDAATTRRLFREGKAGRRMVAVVEAGRSGKTYRLPTDVDLNACRAAVAALDAACERLRAAWGMEPVPDEPTPEGKGSGAERAFVIRNYGFESWGDVFTPRQALALITFADAVRRAHAQMLAQGYEEAFATAVTTYLGLSLDMLAAMTNSLARWGPASESIKHPFDLQALPILWDYAEANPLSNSSGGFSTGQSYLLKVLDRLSYMPPLPNAPRRGTMEREECPARVSLASATHLPYPDGFFDAVLTDPPYYDNVPYSHLSDFFYVWLKRSIGHLHPELFATPLTPKSDEIVAYTRSEGGLAAGKRFFEEQLATAFREIARVLKPNGIAVVVYAHKSTAGWETVINALLDSGLVVNAAWLLNTEMQTRLRARESAALASSIALVARKAKRRATSFINEVRTEVRTVMHRKLDRLWAEGFAGADFFIAAIGAGIEVFGAYEQVIDYEGNVIRADRLLDEVREMATDFAVQRILQNESVEGISPFTRLYLLWRWTYRDAHLPFDEARKLAQSCGLDIAETWSARGAVRRQKEFVHLLGPHERRLEDLKNPRDLMDVLHRALLLWEKGEHADLVQTLTTDQRSDIVYRVAQAISATLSVESREKKLIDGFLAGRERLRAAVEQWGGQAKMNIDEER